MGKGHASIERTAGIHPGAPTLMEGFEHSRSRPSLRNELFCIPAPRATHRP